MDAHSPTVEPTPPPNLRRVRLKPTPATPETNVRTLASQQTASPAASTPETPRFARKRQMSAFEVFEKNTRGDRNDILEPSHPSARLALEAGRGAPNAEAERVPEEQALPFFSRGEEEQTKTRNEARKEARASSEETAAVPSRAHVAARGGAVTIEAVSPLEALASPDPHHACRECAEKDAAIARLAEQRSRLGGFLRAIETLAERQAERETSIEKHLTRLERKLRAYRETLRKYAEISPESSSDASPSPSPWGSRCPSPSPLASGGGGERASRGRFPRVASEDQLGLHKVHGGTRYRAPSLPGTGMGTKRVCGDDADDGRMRE